MDKAGEGGWQRPGGCAGRWAGRSVEDYHPLGPSEGLEHLGQRKREKSWREGGIFERIS